MAFSDIATIGFVFTNGQKVKDGNVGRIPVFAGQVFNAVKAGAQSGNGIAKPAQAVLETCQNAAKSDVTLRYLGKTVKFAADHINPLIVASCGLEVALAPKEKKEETFVNKTGMLLGMFGAEGWMKKNLVGVLDKLPIGGKWKPIVKGLVFIAGSLTGSLIGEKLAKPTHTLLTTPLGKEAREQKRYEQAMKEAQKNSYKPLDYTA